MALTTTEKVDVGEISVYLALEKIAKGGLFGAPLDPRLGLMLAMEADSVGWQNEFDPTDLTLTQTSNYLYSISFGPQAINILTEGSGGVVVNPSTGQPATLAEIRIQFEVGDPDELIADGETVMTIQYSNVIDESVQIFLDTAGEIPINRSDRFSYTIVYSSTEVVVTFNEPVSDGQLFIVRALQTIS